MRHLSFFILALLLFLFIFPACTAFPTASPSLETSTPAGELATASPTPTLTPTITPTASITPLPSPTATPTQPPFDLGNVSEMISVAQAGEGTLGQVAVSPDGQTLAVAGSQGIWLIDKFHLEPFAKIAGHAGEVTGVSWSPDGNRLVSGGEDRTVRVWDVTPAIAGTGEAQQIHLLIAHSERITSVSWSSNPALIASAAEDGHVWIWELSTTQQGEDDARALHQLTHVTAVYAVAWHPEGRYLAVASLDSTLDLWDTLLGVHLMTLEGHESWATTIAWNPTGDILASGATDRTLRLWDVTFTTPSNPASKPTVRAELRTIIQTIYNPNVVTWTPDGTQVVSGGGSPFSINLWDPAPSEDLEEVELRIALRSFNGHFAPIRGLVFAPGGVLISTGEDTTLRVWNVSTGEEIRRLSPHRIPITTQPLSAPIQSLTWSPDGDRIATAHSDYTVRLWDANGTTLTQTQILTGHQNIVTSIDWSANGSWLATGSNDNTTRVWDAQTGQLLQTLNSEGGRVSSVAFAPFGNQLASGGLLRIAQIWEVGTDQPPVLLTSDTEISFLAWAPSGTLLAMGGNDGTITLWDVPAATQILLLAGEHSNPISAITWSPDGSRLATLDTGGKMVIWDNANGVPLNESLINGTRRAGLSWSPNSQLLATADGTQLYLIDAETGQPLRLLVGHDAEIRSVEWKPDGGQLASAGVDGILRLWAMPPTLASPSPAEELTPSSNLPTSLEFAGEPITLENAQQVQQISMLGRGTALHLAANPDGSTLAVAGGMGTWIYDAKTWEHLRLLSGNKTYGSAWSPDGKLLAVREVSSILVWDVENEQVLRVFGMDVGVRPALAWSPDGTMLAAGNFRGVVRVFNLATGEIIYEWQPGRDITSLVWSPDGLTLAAGGTAADTENGLIWLWDIPTGRSINILEGHTARVIHHAWSPDGMQLLSAGDDLALNLWDVSALELPPTPAEGEEPDFTPLTGQTLTGDEITGVVGIAWSSDGSLFMTADASGIVYSWGVESGLIQASLSTPSPSLIHAAWFPDRNSFITVDSHGEINQFNIADGATVATLSSHSAEVRTLHWSGTSLEAPDSIFVAGVDGLLQAFALDGSILETRQLEYEPTALAHFASSGLTAVRNEDGSVEIFQLGSEADGRQVGDGSGEPSTEWFVDWSEDGQFLAWNQTRDETTMIEILVVATGENFSLGGVESKITTLSWSPDLTAEDSPRRGSTQTFRLAAGTEDGKVIVWEVVSGRVLRTIQTYSGRVRAIAWSPDGESFATGGSDGQDNGGIQYVRVWDASSGRLTAELELPFGHEAHSLVWSPDGTMLASGDSFGDVLIWDPDEGVLIGTLHGHQQAVVSVDWSRVSNLIVSGSRDGTVRVWGLPAPNDE